MCSILVSDFLHTAYLLQSCNDHRVAHRRHVCPDFQHLQARPVKERMPLVNIPLHRAEHGIHVQIQAGRPPVYAGVGQYHVVNQNLGVRAHGGNDVLEDLLRLVIGPVVENCAEVVETSSYSSMSKHLVSDSGHEHTYDWLRVEEVVGHKLNALDWWHCLSSVDSLLQILHNDAARKIWVLGLQSPGLMTNAASNIDKECTVWLN